MAARSFSFIKWLPLLFGGLSVSACADELGENFSLHGFGTLGFARSSADQVEFVRDLSQPAGIKSGQWSSRIDSVLGVQANWQPHPEFALVGQAVTRYRYDSSNLPEVTWAFAKWEPDSRVTLRGGRLGADFLMMADSRLVGYSYLPVRPPVDFFGPLFFSYFDGADASATAPVGDGLLRGKVYAGTTREKNSNGGVVWNVDGSLVRGVVTDFQQGPWTFRASLATIRFSRDIALFGVLPDSLRAAGTAIGAAAALAAADSLTIGGTTSRFHMLGAVYDEGGLQVQGMLNTITNQSGVLQDSRSGYLLAGYRVGAITPYAGVSWWKTRTDLPATGLPDAPFGPLNRGYAMVMRDSVADQRTYTLGARWDVRRNVALKAQWDAIRGSTTSLFPFRGDLPGWNGRTNVVTATMDFVF